MAATPPVSMSPVGIVHQLFPQFVLAVGMVSSALMKPVMMEIGMREMDAPALVRLKVDGRVQEKIPSVSSVEIVSWKAQKCVMMETATPTMAAIVVIYNLDGRALGVPVL